MTKFPFRWAVYALPFVLLGCSGSEHPATGLTSLLPQEAATLHYPQMKKFLQDANDVFVKAGLQTLVTNNDDICFLAFTDTKETGDFTTYVLDPKVLETKQLRYVAAFQGKCVYNPDERTDECTITNDGSGYTLFYGDEKNPLARTLYKNREKFTKNEGGQKVTTQSCKDVANVLRDHIDLQGKGDLGSMSPKALVMTPVLRAMLDDPRYIDLAMKVDIP